MSPFVLIPIAVIFVVAMVIGRNELVKRKLDCPRKKKTAEVELLRRSLWPSKLVRVKRCSLLEAPTKINCDQECLKTSS